MLVGPKIESDDGQGVRYHAKEFINARGDLEWTFEERQSTLQATHMLLVRVLIGKVEDCSRIAVILRTTPIRPDVEGWNCVAWVMEALERVKADGKALGTSVLDWETVRNESMEYCQRKKDQHRFDGQRKFTSRLPPTYDLIERKETIA